MEENKIITNQQVEEESSIDFAASPRREASPSVF